MDFYNQAPAVHPTAGAWRYWLIESSNTGVKSLREVRTSMPYFREQ